MHLSGTPGVMTWLAFLALLSSMRRRGEGAARHHGDMSMFDPVTEINSQIALVKHLLAYAPQAKTVEAFREIVAGGWTSMEIFHARGFGGDLPTVPPEVHSSKEAERALAMAHAWLLACKEEIDGPVSVSALNKMHPVAIDAEDESILAALLKNKPKLLTQEEIESESRVSRRTVSTRMANLLASSLVQQPRGPRSGTTIAPDGEAILTQISRAQSAH